ncbi:HpcH/HpaI aldolase/citrate lyase family protein [Wenxinia saemankumensis]|uniref:Citrate lyase subunit beta / citryl-CoA lyase n=1 Tax=Wenxinia saemankumensis TaxID=1447782 RepID=A0A1M6D0E7_9RHOB|nr:CoA ester lyase [Wenxinia saemankumensis]SHI66726.1 citrate lyase subunit beta / citryl-CoA lyase [Wenxinia saemankumensis]
MSAPPRLTSLLFVPADSPRKFDRARGAGASALILDLEDSVAPARKAEARDGLAAQIAAAEGARDWSLWVRVNPFGTGLTEADLAAVIRPGLDGIVLPKAEGGADIARLAALMDGAEAAAGLDPGHLRILAIATETPAAMFALGSYAPAHPRLAALTWGAEDLSAELGATTNRDAEGGWTDPYRLARSLCLYAAAHAGVAAIETLHADYRDAAGLAATSRAARRDGFAGRLAIHPAQVAPIEDAFAPTGDELAEARAIVAAFEADPGLGTVGIEGRMVDIPHLRRARRILASRPEE